MPKTAHAEGLPLFIKGSTSKTVNVAPSVTAKEKKAYQRALKACMDYENQSNPIVVDVSSFGLTQAQALHVGYLLHSNGELFWINTFGSDEDDKEMFGTKTFRIPVYYDDATITRMRKKLDASANKALKRITSDMDAATKIHTLHDYLIDKMDYKASYKTSYDGLVRGGGDCFGFARTMDLLLRRAGFQTDMAYNYASTHSWNLVKVDGEWYHVDVTWDNGWSGKYYWKKTRCHFFLLQPDSQLAGSEQRGGWWAHHKCNDATYVEKAAVNGSFKKECNNYKLYINGFTVDGLKYKACGSGKVKLAGVSSAAKKKAKSLAVPASVSYKNKRYSVAGIGASALAGSKAKTISIASSGFSASRVKNSLVGSNVSKVKLTGAAVKKKAAYKKYFAKGNCGKKVIVV